MRTAIVVALSLALAHDAAARRHGGLSNRTSWWTVRVSTLRAHGSLSARTVRRLLQKNGSKLSYCYEKTLMTTPDLGRRATLRFTVAANGTVSGTDADGIDGVSDCFHDVLHAIPFPTAARDTRVAARLTFVLESD